MKNLILKQHVDEIQYSNVNTEVIEWRNIDNTDMCLDEYESRMRKHKRFSLCSEVRIFLISSKSLHLWV